MSLRIEEQHNELYVILFIIFRLQFSQTLVEQTNNILHNNKS